MIGSRRTKRWLLPASILLTIAILAPGVGSQGQQPAQTPPVVTAGRSAQPWRGRVGQYCLGLYHKPSSRHYGKTKHGKYMTEPNTVRAGYRPARN